ncbi:MAG: aspartate aminotransferase family protein [Victivallaceae bacterium]|nr:aspartate aminotransferase family protein [Victivallaceae bacterium]
MSNYSDQIKATYHQYVMPTYAPQQLLIRGKGAYVWDADDRKYLDFAMGISVCNLGHCHDAVTRAVTEQAQKLVHVSNLYYNEVNPRLAEALVKQGFDAKVFFCNSGAEANEGLIKLARKFGNETGRNQIISMVDSFHGRTLATLAATGRSKYRKGFQPDMPGFVQVPFNDLEAVRQAITDQTCAVLLEPVQGEGGIIPAEVEYLQQLRKLCDEKNILLLFDEVQCGMGRTGTFFAFQGFGVEPDALSMAKAMANGLPMGAFLVRRKFSDILTVGMHASTFGGTPLVSAAALAVLETFQKEKILENCRDMSAILRGKLEKLIKPYAFAKCVRGKGLLMGIVFDRAPGRLREILLEKGLIVLTAGETVLRLLPPLNVKEGEIEEAVKIIGEGLVQWADEIASAK